MRLPSQRVLPLLTIEPVLQFTPTPQFGPVDFQCGKQHPGEQHDAVPGQRAQNGLSIEQARPSRPASLGLERVQRVLPRCLLIREGGWIEQLARRQERGRRTACHVVAQEAERVACDGKAKRDERCANAVLLLASTAFLERALDIMYGPPNS